MSHRSTFRRLGIACVAACAVLGVVSPAAFAGGLVQKVVSTAQLFANETAGSLKECRSPALSQPFAPFGDTRDYTLVPGGDFSSPLGAGWQFSGGARIVADSHDGGALELPKDAMAISPVLCVDETFPTARMWARGVAKEGRVKVYLAYAGSKSALDPVSSGDVRVGGTAWTLSRDILVRPELGGEQPGWRKVAFILVGDSDRTRVDDFYVDPRMVR